MSTRSLITFLMAAAAVSACSKDDSAASAAAASASAAAAAASASAAAAAAAAAATSAAPAVSAAPPPPRSDCPKGSTGPGTFNLPCAGSGTTRLMEVAWTGKTDDKGPQFRVVNKDTRVILYGKVAVYFYDKAGKQMDFVDTDGKKHPYKTCGGNIFGGVMKAGEKAVVTFSCVSQKSVPDGATAIEAEAQMVGFSDATEKKSEFYWKNDDLAPDARKKGAKK